MLEAARVSFCTVSIIDMDGPLELQPLANLLWLISLTAASVSSLLLSRIINSSRWR